MTNDQAMARWQAGHHAFFALLQGLVFVHRQLEAALSRGDDAAARRALNRAARMLDGSAAAMLFAGDMPTECYVGVRQSMTPPNVPDKFSGLWSVDHRAMMDDLKGLRQRLAGLDESMRDSLQEWQAALDRTYMAHACVCEQFVGDGPSLAMQPQGGGGCNRSALENIEAFRRRALALVATGDAVPDTVPVSTRERIGAENA